MRSALVAPHSVNERFEATGGARVGWMNATWPLAKLTATSTSLRIVVRLIGDYYFTPNTVVGITRYTMIPILGWGIQIQHTVPEYPARFIFWCIGSPNTLLAGIREAGFQPLAPVSAIPARTGMAFRWQAVAICLVVWNGLVLLDISSSTRPVPTPGPLSLLALVLLFAACLACLRVPFFQHLILKRGRSVDEIRPMLNLFLVISGFMTVIMAIINVSQ